MPHRILTEPIAAAAVFTASLTGWLTDKDWERLVGPWGGMLVSLCMVVVLLRHSAKRISKEDTERERRHQESMELQTKLGERLDKQNESMQAVAIESIKAQAKVTGAIERLDSNAQRMTLEFRELSDGLKVRPCQMQMRPMPVEREQ